MTGRWTFMVYMAGFNSLSDFATKDLEELRSVGSTDNVRIAVFLKQLSEKSAYHLILGRDGKDEVRERLGPVDSGSPQTLLDFVRWSARQAPADRYALVVWNHGSGWQPDDLDDLYDQVRRQQGDTGVSPRELGVRSTQQIARALFDTSVKQVLGLSNFGERAIASDDGTGHSLDTIELGRVLQHAATDLGGPLEVLGMDACLMSTLEVAYEGQEYAKIVVGSEELEPGDGWPYERILAELTADPGMDGEALGEVIVRNYLDSYGDRYDQWPVTQSALRTKGIAAFAQVLDELATALKAHLHDEVDAAKVLRAQSNSVRFDGELIDLATFCLNLRDGAVHDKVKRAADKVIRALSSAKFLVAEGHLGPSVEGCGGVTAYFPPPTEEMSKYYADLRFARERAWDDFLQAYQTAVRGR